MTSLVPKRRGKLRREEQSLPPYVQRSFIAYANGCSWIQAAEIAGTTTQNLREWRKHPEAQAFIQQAIDLNLEGAHKKFADNAEQLAEELVDLALSPKTRGYAKVQAIDTCFKILNVGVTERRNREELEQIRSALDQLEGNRAPDVIDVESNG